MSQESIPVPPIIPNKWYEKSNIVENDEHEDYFSSLSEESEIEIETNEPNPENQQTTSLVGETLNLVSRQISGQGIMSLTRQFSTDFINFLADPHSPTENYDPETQRIGSPRRSEKQLLISYESFQSFFVTFPLFVIPLLMLVHTYYLEICFFIYMTAILSYFNKSNVKLFQKFSSLKMIITIFCMVGNLILINFIIFPEERLYKYFLFYKINPKYEVFKVIYVAIILDFNGKLLCLLIKSYLICFLNCIKFIGQKKKGKILSFLEHIIFIFRSFVPVVTLWLPFLTNDINSKQGVSYLLLGIILSFKFLSTLMQVKEFYRIIIAFFVKQAEYGEFVLLGDNQMDDECSICREFFEEPIKLNCGHVFCNECIEHWCKKEKSCPLCRKEIKCSNSSYGSNGISNLVPLII